MLNKKQQDAVESNKKQLMVMSGPGSGKTRVITQRVVHLLKTQHLSPHSVIVTTFTNKAAKEIKQRLYGLLPERRNDVEAMLCGTFHHVSTLFLRKYGRAVGLKNNFVIYGADECEKIVKKLVKEKFQLLAATKMKMNHHISSVKNKNSTPEESTVFSGTNESSKKLKGDFVSLFHEYEKFLRQENALDFDDLLLFCLRLFKKEPWLAKSIQHVLIDEFQDTNGVQYLLMEQLVANCQCVTIVGDPDQSIYGWRSADVRNLIKFRDHYSEKDLDIVFLEQNYRSTKNILSVALDVIRQDKSRLDKGLWTDNQKGLPVFTQKFPSEKAQAASICSDIQAIMSNSGGILKYSDFCILYRTNRQSNFIQQHMQILGLPFRVYGGVKFFDRKEIKDLLCYLRLASNPNDSQAFLRIVNVPPRGVGEKTVESLLADFNADTSKVSLLEHVRKKAKGKAKVNNFLDLIETLSELIDSDKPLREILESCIGALDYVNYLKAMDKKKKPKKTITAGQDDDENTDRVLTMNEFFEFLDSFEYEFRNSHLESRFRMTNEIPLDFVNDNNDNTEGKNPVDSKYDENTRNDKNSDPLGKEEVSPEKDLNTAKLLEALFEKLTLDAAPDALQSDRKAAEKISLMTMHTSKGLEFPFIWLINVEFEYFPHKLNPNADEERRLLFVGITRAMCSLVMTMTTASFGFGGFRGFGDDFGQDKCWSPFISPLIKKKREDLKELYGGESVHEQIGKTEWEEIAKQLNRPFDSSTIKTSDQISGFKRSTGNMFKSALKKYKNEQ